MITLEDASLSPEERGKKEIAKALGRFATEFENRVDRVDVDGNVFFQALPIAEMLG